MKFAVGVLAILLIITFVSANPEDVPDADPEGTEPEGEEPEVEEPEDAEPPEVDAPEVDPEACQNCIMNNIGRCTVIFGPQAHCCPPAVETCCQENPDDIDDCYDREFEECCLTK